MTILKSDRDLLKNAGVYLSHSAWDLSPWVPGPQFSGALLMVVRTAGLGAKRLCHLLPPSVILPMLQLLWACFPA